MHLIFNFLPLLVLFAVGGITPSAAQNSPYPGVFDYNLITHEFDVWKKSACLSGFNIMHEDGTYELYHVDPAQLFQNDRLAYNLYESGRCQFDHDSRIESCKPGYNFVGDLTPIFGLYRGKWYGNSEIWISYSKAELVRVSKQGKLIDKNPKGKNSVFRAWQLSCNIDPKILEPLVSRQPTKYSGKEVWAIIGNYGIAPLKKLHQKIREKIQFRPAQ